MLLGHPFIVQHKHWIRAFAAAACFYGAQAQAGQHFICFEGQPEQKPDGKWLLKAVAVCRDDSGAPCSFTPDTTGSSGTFWTLDQTTTSAIGTFFTYVFSGSGSGAGDLLKLNARFVNQNPKFNVSCTVQARGVDPATGAILGNTEGVLTGFSSDETGLVSTGVWRKTLFNETQASLRVPWDFIVSGGGFQSSSGAYVWNASYSSSIPNVRTEWQVNSRRDISSINPPAFITAYAVGLRIHGLDSRDFLNDSVRLTRGFSDESTLNQGLTHSALITRGPGRVIVGGGIKASFNPFDIQDSQAVTATAPMDIRSLLCSLGFYRPAFCRSGGVQEPLTWSVQSRGIGTRRSSSSLTGEIRTIPGLITVNGKSYFVFSRYIESTSPPGRQCVATVAGMRGEYAITSAGAAILFDRRRGASPSRTRLSEVIPLLNEGGAKASALPPVGGCSSDEAVTAYATGIKLVEVPLRLPPLAPLPFNSPR